ncbi:DUF2059 domain-containing protein [Paracoccus liaowanqingii]|uniref:DUF2059 domain-containing protein n=1 Tax=Paracoccus liaowanqingii TaxID=2560053 RepID=A0A4Z1BQP5_9RHOB|nr:DUF2059 domain-containing protein [Paracoccus liaowanqingii]TGN45156.1 DUF2059 domain-containing protein [Paracoccus liaowanqingii]
MLSILGLMAALAASGPSPAGTDWSPATIHRVQAQDSDRQQQADRLWQVLGMDGLMPVMQAEAVGEAARMQAEGLIAGQGPDWARTIGRIHDPARLERLFRDSLAEALARTDAGLVDRALGFHASELGQQVVGLEISARRAMLEEGVEPLARQSFAEALDQGAPRARAIRDIIDRADLISPNVAGGLNAALAFARGFAEGDGFDMAPDPQQIVRDAWAQRDQIETEATAWLQGFLMLAYAPLSDAELAAYGAWAASAEGQALSRIVFAGFDGVFEQTSYEMGLAAALRLQGRQL